MLTQREKIIKKVYEILENKPNGIRYADFLQKKFGFHSGGTARHTLRQRRTCLGRGESSPFSRCKRTAEIAKEVLGIKDEILFDNRLKERWFGDFGRTHNSNYQKVWDYGLLAGILKFPIVSQKNL